MALAALEEEMDKDTLKKYECRLEEGYDCLEDPLYLTMLEEIEAEKQSCNLNKDEIKKTQAHFEIPVLTEKKKPTQSTRGTASLPKHISGER